MCDLWLSACTQSFSIKEYCQKFQSSSSIYQQAINKNNKLDVIQSPIQKGIQGMMPNKKLILNKNLWLSLNDDSYVKNG
jgi:hypothetical protein